jgi:sucrose phosphorylase
MTDQRSERNHFDSTHTTHATEADFEKPLLQLTDRQKKMLKRRLAFLYPDENIQDIFLELERVMQVYYAHKSEDFIQREAELDPAERFTEQDVILITYGDLIRGDGQSPLKNLADFCDFYLKGAINTLHILPFFPYSSDRGFSITDYEVVDPHLGTWEDIKELEYRYQLMFDGVINHMSAGSRWFREWRADNPVFRDFVISFDSPDEMTPEQKSKIFRPRTSDILTRFHTIRGPKYVWTTFSQDQVDLNYGNPRVLIKVLEILLFYVRHGADILRLDAVTYLWAELGTRCASLEETHEIVKLVRDVLNICAPSVAIVTETNVPHEENISYFGKGNDEAHMVYNFALPPLVLYTFYRENVTTLSQWAENLSTPSRTTTYFNFLDSHDGIGVMAVKDLLPAQEIDFLVNKANNEYGAQISYKTDSNGMQVPYELNVTWFSALNNDADDEDLAFQVKRFVASRAISLVIAGVPGIYLHSLIGTVNDIEAVLSSESNRAINRSIIDFDAINQALADPLSKVSRINRELGRIIKIRTEQRCFHPNGSQRILMINKGVFSVERSSPESDEVILSLINVTDSTIKLEIEAGSLSSTADEWYDLISETTYYIDEARLSVTLGAYDIIWLKAPRSVTPEN